MAAKNTIPMLVDIYKNRNTASKTYGQFYGRVFPRDGLNLKGFANRVSAISFVRARARETKKRDSD